MITSVHLDWFQVLEIYVLEVNGHFPLHRGSLDRAEGSTA